MGMPVKNDGAAPASPMAEPVAATAFYQNSPGPALCKQADTVL